MGPQAPRLKLPPRVVLDTNVLVSALVFGGQSWAWLRLAWQCGQMNPIVSRAMAQELLDVLAYPKFKLAAAEREMLLADYLPYTEAVAVPARVRGLPDIRDADDRMVLALAVAGRADCIVSGDADLLAVRDGWPRIPILAPAEFRVWMGM